MLLSTVTLFLLACATVLIAGMPFQPLSEGPLQHSRRRAIDYPQEYHNGLPVEHRRAKRSIGYSVVQVDGGPSSSAAPAPPPAPSTIMQTVTRPGSPPPPANTQTLVSTTTMPSPLSAETVRLTTTQETEKTVTERPSSSVPAPSSNAPSSSPSPSPAPVVPWTSTVVHVVTSTATTSQPQAFYDDGLWHTYYPIKTFLPPGYSTSTPLESTSSVSTSTWTPSASSTWTPQASWSRTSTWSSTYAAPSQAEAWQPAQKSAGNLTSPNALQARKIPANLKLASWNITTGNETQY